MTGRLLIACCLMLLLAAEFVGVIWWQLYHSRLRTDARDRARRRRKELTASVSPHRQTGAEASREH